MSVELKNLAAFVAVVDAGSFTDAALELGMSQAAVSRSIAKLESELGVSVLRRTTRRVGTTSMGLQLIPHARRVLAGARQIEQIASSGRDELRIGYAWAAFGAGTAQLQRLWATRNADVRLTFVQSETPTAGLVDGLVDAAVVRTPIELPGVESTLLGVESRFAALASDDRWCRRRSIRMADFGGRTVAINRSTGTTVPDLWPAEGRPNVVDTHSLDEWLTTIMSGEAVGLTAAATAAMNPRPGIVYKPVRDASPIPVHLIWWANDAHERIQSLVSMACEALGSTDTVC